MRVVLIKLNSLGDNIVFVPVVQELRRRYPDWELTLVTTPRESELYGGPLAPKRLIVSPKPSFNKAYRRPWDLVRWILRIRKIKPDACLVAFDQSNVAHLVAKCSGAKIRIGGNLEIMKISRSLTEDVPMPEDGRPVTWDWRIAGALARSAGSRAPWPAKPPKPDFNHLLTQRTVRTKGRKRVVVHAGASKSFNQWPRNRFASVANALSHDFEVVWIEHGKTTGPAPEGTVPAPVITIAELASWLADADLFLGNNSGPMHLANALGCAGVVVTGPSAIGWDPYWYPERWTVLRHPNLYCAPCEKPNKDLGFCANTASPMACLEYWTEEKVEAACRLQLRREADLGS